MTTKFKNKEMTGKRLPADIVLPALTESTVLPSAWGPDHNPIEAGIVFKRSSGLASAILLNALAEPLQYIDEPTTEQRFKARISSLGFADFWKPGYPRYKFEESIAKLKGFQFNGQSPLEESLTSPFDVGVCLEKSRATFSIKHFVPNRDISWPGSNTSCRIKTTLTGIDLDTGDFRTVCSYSPLFTKNMKVWTNYEAITDLPSSDYPLLIYCCGIDFFINYGKNHLVRIPDTIYNPMDIVAAQFNNQGDKY